ncbi:MAG: hypothetical protein A2V77_19745 [Anaeromyxobacter sp. RBG_16_69_14]|nr:MAG: hypothetical protein A2V77_19745 [Anaeromyxobacter sp. RBG_16_69_14]
MHDALHEASDPVATAPPPGPADVPAAVRAAIAAAVALPGASAEVLELTGALPARCSLTRAEAPRPVSASGRVALHLFGRDGAERCDGWAWVRVRVSAPSLVTTRAIMEGAALEGAVAAVEREVVAGRPPVTTLPEGAVADRALAAGVPLDEAHFRIGARPGQAVAVVLRAGALAVEQRGQAIACRRGRACALLPTGRRVEGTWHDGRIQLESP